MSAVWTALNVVFNVYLKKNQYMYLKIKIINDEQVKIKKRFFQIGIFFMQIVSKTVKQVIILQNEVALAW